MSNMPVNNINFGLTIVSFSQDLDNERSLFDVKFADPASHLKMILVRFYGV